MLIYWIFRLTNLMIQASLQSRWFRWIILHIGRWQLILHLLAISFLLLVLGVSLVIILYTEREVETCGTDTDRCNKGAC